MRNKSMIIIIAVLLVVLVAAAGVGAFFFIRSSNAEAQSAVEEEVTVLHLSEAELFDMPLAEAIRTNLATSVDETEHFISTELEVGINNTLEKESPEFITLISEKEGIVRNVAISVIRKKTYEELKRPDGMEQLQNDILVQLQEQFNSNLIVRVIASDYILQ